MVDRLMVSGNRLRAATRGKQRITKVGQNQTQKVTVFHALCIAAQQGLEMLTGGRKAGERVLRMPGPKLELPHLVV